jgi:hypothetical protein
VPRKKVPVAVRTQVEGVGVPVNGGEVRPADRLARRRLLQLRDAVTPSLNDWIVQLQIAERTALRRLPLRERNDAWYLRRNDARPDGATVK